jgi:uncharacterized membrane protein YhaH (DUF805 family)
MNYEQLFVNPTGRTARSEYVPALLTLLAAFTFYWFLVTGRTGQFALLVMLVPGLVLHARRLHDIGRSGWLVLIPGAVLLAAGLFHLFAPEADATRPLKMAAFVAAAAFILWGLVGPSRSEPAA